MLKRTPNKHEPVDIGDGLKVFGGNGGFDGYTIAGKHYDAETSKRIDAVAKALGFTLHEAAAMVDKTDAAKTPEPAAKAASGSTTSLETRRALAQMRRDLESIHKMLAGE